MNNKKGLWVTVSLANLCIVAFFGMMLRSKYLFPISVVNYRYFISAHSHFAFGGWVTLALFILYIYFLLPEHVHRKKVYQWILWSTEINALGMAVSFPFEGYAFFSILFSTLFIFTTYTFAIVFLLDLKKIKANSSISLLSSVALISLVISSVGPFTLAYILATKSANSILYRDAVYTYLHFQYNGFFTLSVFALLFRRVLAVNTSLHKNIKWFAILLSCSILPALFLSLLWHSENFIHVAGYIGFVLVLSALLAFLLFFKKLLQQKLFIHALAWVFCIFSIISFIIKMLLQTGTVVPSLANAVFGYRPIIIGFLHLVFLGMVSFYILSEYIEDGMFYWKNKLTRNALLLFAVGIILNETVLMIQGIGLMFLSAFHFYAWLLWIISIVLFLGAVLIMWARLKTVILANKKSHVVT